METKLKYGWICYYCKAYKDIDIYISYSNRFYNNFVSKKHTYWCDNCGCLREGIMYNNKKICQNNTKEDNITQDNTGSVHKKKSYFIIKKPYV